MKKFMVDIPTNNFTWW